MTTVVTSENLAEFNAQRMGLSAPAEAATAEPVVEATEDSADVSDDAEPQEEQTEKEEPKKANPKLEKRFSELTKQREDARREAQQARDAAAALEAKVKEYEAKLAPPAKEDAKPTPQQFTDAFEYAEALAEWSAEQALKNRDKAEIERKQQAERQKILSDWEKRQQSARDTLGDYADVVAGSEVVVSDQVRDAIIESDVGPQILYHLAKNPDFAESLQSKSVVSALREIGKLEAKLSGDKPSAAPVEKPSKAPPPINPIKATKSIESSLAADGEFHGTYAQWKEARQAGRIK